MGQLIHFVVRFMTIWSCPNCIYPLTIFYFSPTVRRSIYGQCWSIKVLIREWVNGVLIERLIRQTVVWSTDYRSVRRSTSSHIFLGLRFWGLLTISIDVQDGLWVRLRPSMATVYCTCRFSEKLFLVYFGYRVLQIWASSVVFSWSPSTIGTHNLPWYLKKRSPLVQKIILFAFEHFPSTQAKWDLGLAFISLLILTAI